MPTDDDASSTAASGFEGAPSRHILHVDRDGAQLLSVSFEVEFATTSAITSVAPLWELRPIFKYSAPSSILEKTQPVAWIIGDLWDDRPDGCSGRLALRQADSWRRARPMGSSA
jgi:hypothetical protein